MCEEITRFILNSAGLTQALKGLRHGISRTVSERADMKLLLGQRDSRRDVGFGILEGELKRRDCGDIFTANIQRAKESVRVLEEFFKLSDARAALACKRIRYRLYEVEKKAAPRLSSLRDHR